MSSVVVVTHGFLGKNSCSIVGMTFCKLPIPISFPPSPIPTEYGCWSKRWSILALNGVNSIPRIFR